MGLFSSKYETHVATTATRVIEDKALPHSVKTGVLRSLIQHDDQMIESAMEELVNCIGIKVNSMYNYGRDHYMHGLPTASLQVSTSGEALIKSTIELEKGPITIDYYHYGMLNTLHVGWVKLIELYNYNPVTNTMVVGGNAVYLQDMAVVVKEATLNELQNGSLDQWGIPASAGVTPIRLAMPDQTAHTPWTTDATAPNDYLHVTYTWQNPATLVMSTATLDIQVTGFDDLASYHHVKYKKVSDNSIGYWLYKADAGDYPAIDKLHTPAWETGGTYFPWGYFRHEKTPLGVDMTQPENIQMKKLMKYLSMDFDQVADAINENPDIDQVEQAMLMMGVPAVTTNEIELRYLFDYFDSLYGLTDGDLGPSKQVQGLINKLLATVDSSILDQAFIIQDKKFKLSLGFRKMYKTRVSGVVAAVGKHVMENGRKNITSTGANGQVQTTNVSFHIYRHQVSDSTYEEIEILNLKMKYYVYQEYAVTADENDDILLIPLDKSITENYSVPIKEILYARSLHYIFNSRVIQEIKWYQQSWFRGLMIVVAVIITILSWGKTWQLIVAAMAIGASLITIAMIIVLEILKQLLIAYLIKLFVKVVGTKVAFLVALIAVIYGGFQAMEAGSVQGSPWAKELLALGNGLVKEIGKDIQRDYDALKKEASEFNDMIKTKKEKLEEAQNELGYNNYLAPTVVFGESPNEFYDRTVHSGNIGVMGLDAITSYVEVSLTLPKLNQTLGEDAYGNSILG